MEIPRSATNLAALEALRNQQHNLEETIGRLVALMKSLPEGEARDRLLDEISALDVIAEVMRRAPPVFIFTLAEQTVGVQVSASFYISNGQPMKSANKKFRDNGCPRFHVFAWILLESFRIEKLVCLQVKSPKR